MKGWLSLIFFPPCITWSCKKKCTQQSVAKREAKNNMLIYGTQVLNSLIPYSNYSWASLCSRTKMCCHPSLILNLSNTIGHFKVCLQWSDSDPSFSVGHMGKDDAYLWKASVCPFLVHLWHGDSKYCELPSVEQEVKENGWN